MNEDNIVLNLNEKAKKEEAHEQLSAGAEELVEHPNDDVLSEGTKERRSEGTEKGGKRMAVINVLTKDVRTRRKRTKKRKNKIHQESRSHYKKPSRNRLVKMNSRNRPTSHCERS